MKIPALSHHIFCSVVALGFGCGLAVLPAGNIRAEETSAKAEASVKLSEKEKHFIHKARAGNASEVEGGNLALKNADRADVKEFGQKMIDDHSKANTDLAEVERKAGLTVTEPKPTAEQKKMSEHMMSLKGKAFDEAYIKDMIEDHKKDIAEYKEAKAMAKDPALVAYIDQTLTTIEGHLKMVEELAKK